MKRSAGIALVITLMIAVLLFIAIIAISSSFSLSGRRLTTDQKLALEAQYAAESGLALASARLRSFGTGMAQLLDDDDAFELPANTDWLSLRPEIVNFCGSEEAVPATRPAVASTICTADLSGVDWDDPEHAPYSLFLQHVESDAYPEDPETGLPVTAENFWRSYLGPQQTSLVLKDTDGVETKYTVEYGFVPREAKVLADGSIRFEFVAMPTLATGYLENGGDTVASRQLQQKYPGHLYVDVSPPSFSHYMMFTNYQRAGASTGAPRVYFYDGTLFDGPVHTNEHFNFIGRPWFGDSVTSAGCTKENHDKDDCLVAEPGFYYWDTIGTGDVFTPPILPPPAYMNTNPHFTREPEWDVNYIKLPRTGDDQYQAAVLGGIQIDDHNNPKAIGQRNIDYVALSIGEEGGTKYQYIQVFGRELVGTEEVPGYCAPNGGGGGGSGGGGSDDSGPSVWSPQPPTRALVVLWSAGAPVSPVRWMAAELAERAESMLVLRAETCPEGQHWVPPKTKKIFEKFTYSFRIDESGLVEINDGDGWTYYASDFNGVLYVGTPDVSGGFTILGAGLSDPVESVNPWATHRPRSEVDGPGDCGYTLTEFDGKYYCIEPSIANFTQITIVGHYVALQRDLTYEERPCESAPERQEGGGVVPASCTGLDARNILGIYTDSGDIRINGNAPPNMYIDGVLMSGKRSVYYANWKKGDPRGYLYLTGGIIQNWYGRFGMLDDDLDILHGYGRKFTYDPRLRNSGLAPPYFPKFEGELPWAARAVFEEADGNDTPGFWKPVAP
ncbi:DUF4900 domain-containing protein [Oceanithermus sp.]